MPDLCDLTATELRRMIGRKDISPVELVESCIDRVESVDGSLNAMVTKSYDRARAEARDAEKAVLAGDELGLLHGIPVGIKDLEATAGIRTTSGSQLYAEHVPAQDQGSVANIRDAGGIILGKTNTPEFGAGANTRNLIFGATGNPFDPARTCGGSSGGSAVALATGMVPLASGSDYGGSLRTPASFCGVVGIRPSPGVVAAEGRPVGLLPFSGLGPMGRTVEDACLLLQAQAGPNPHDPFSTAPVPELYSPPENADLGSIRAMITPDLGSAAMSRSYRDIFTGRAGMFRHHFAAAIDSHPDFTDGDNCFEVLRGVNFVAAHGARVRDHRDRLSPNVVDNVDRGLAYSLADVAEAHLQQSRIARAWLDLFEDIDVVICPGASTTPFPHDQWSITEIDGTQMDTYMRWLGITYLPTMALACGVTIPCGLDHAGMPFGIQVLSAPGNDRLVIEVARALESVLAGHEATARPRPDLDRLKV
ncbi:MAG: amidase family protein [Pseudomonadota bacterium]|nr:amidase family protein [Pseudomonadota bacterium]